ncbi:MAG: hypothetical protein HY560_09180 [Gemmatimonadetes bacterium]|nr:hypothetical protein [Gemmatimonadota bacterium]
MTRETGKGKRETFASSRRLVALVLVAPGFVLVFGCGRERDMPERAELRDSMPVMRAMQSPMAADSMLDTMPGGEMARGDSAAAMKLLKQKM